MIRDCDQGNKREREIHSSLNWLFRLPIAFEFDPMATKMLIDPTAINWSRDQSGPRLYALFHSQIKTACDSNDRCSHSL